MAVCSHLSACHQCIIGKAFMAINFGIGRWQAGACLIKTESGVRLMVFKADPKLADEVQLTD
jgi:hypothetical protein